MSDRRDDDATQRFEPRPEPEDADDTVLADDRYPDEPTRAMGAPLGGEEQVSTRRVEEVSTYDTTSTQRIAVPTQRALGPALIATLAVLGLLLGGLFGYMQSDRPDDNVVDRALVGPEGGRLQIGEEGELVIPKGALPTMTSIIVRKDVNANRVRLGAQEDGQPVVYEPGELPVYAFEPPDLRFQQPVTITLPKSSEVNGVLVDSDDPRVIAPKKVGDRLVVIETTSFSFE